MTHLDLRPLVPGARRRRGASNHLVNNTMNIGTWNVRTLNNEGNLEILIHCLKRLNIRFKYKF